MKYSLGTISRKGYNANERPTGFKTAPSGSIRANAPTLADLMDTLHNHGRSAYACAEAQALARLLNEVDATGRFDEIEFNCPTDSSGQELWILCDNCLSWLEKKGGWGARKKFKLAAHVVNKLQPQANNQEFDIANANFPKLGSKN